MERITKHTVFSAQSVTTTGSVTSSAINFDRRDGFSSFQLHLTATASGSIAITPLASNDGVDYSIPKDEDGVRMSAFVTGFTATGGPDGDGKDLFALKLPIARFYKFKATASTSKVTIAKGILAVQ